MKEQCYDKGTIQAFFDGELSADNLEKIARHAAFCEKCAALLKETEDESSLIFAAMDAELNSLVPTERIRTNLYRAISEIEKSEESEKGFLSWFSNIFSYPSVSAFASLLIVAGIVGIYLFINKFDAEFVAVKNPEPQNKELKQTIESLPPSELGSIAESETNLPDNYLPAEPVVKNNRFAGGAKVLRAGFRESSVKPKVSSEKKIVALIAKANNFEPNNAASVEGEDVYLETIASLNKSVEKNKDEVLKPSARFAFEKDLAIVDDAIVKMKKEVKTNPQNTAAKEMLKSSYQSKIDLLNSVAERQMLTAALR